MSQGATDHSVSPRCNICGSAVFEPFRGRVGEVCSGCGAKARHRAALEIYRRHLFPRLAGRPARVLHFAPEACLHAVLADRLGAGYFTADIAPEIYPHAQALKLRLPDDLGIFPDAYFDAVLHNHVLEHIPGHWRDHVAEMMRVVKPGGAMIFSVPGPYMDRDTQEGGEHLASDAERLDRFLQEDHFKRFGRDFVPALADLGDAELVAAGLDDARRAEIGVRPGKSPFYVLRKRENART